MRFKEFEGEWRENVLGSLGDFIGGGTPSSSNTNFWQGDIPWVSSSDIKENNVTLINKTRFINQKAIENSATKLCPAPVLLIVSRVGVGKVAYSRESLCTSQDFTNIINLKCNGIFLTYFLSVIMRLKAKKTQGTSIKGITSAEIKSLKLHLPNIEEQEKIGAFLSLIDKRIETQNKGINDHLHNLYGDEVEVSLAQLGNSYSGLSGKSGDDFGSGKPYITYMNVYQNKVIDQSMIGYVKVANGEQQNIVCYGDALFTISSETPDEVGIGAAYLGKNEELYLNSFCFGFRLRDFNILNPEYMPYGFSSHKFRKFVYPLAQGSTRFNLHMTDFQGKKFRVPNIKNQIKILNLLNSISEKLTKEKNIASVFQQQKIYFLQSLFI